MEELDIDEVVDVPDTPDRLGARRIIGRGSVGRDRDSPFAEIFRRRVSIDILDENHVNELRAKDKPVAQNGRSGRPVIHPPKSFSNSTSFGNLNVVSTTGNSFSSQNVRLLRKAPVDESSSHMAKSTSGVRNMDKGKSISIDKSSNCQEGTDFFDLTKSDEYAANSKAIRPNGTLKHAVSEDKKIGQMPSSGSSSGLRLQDSSDKFRNAFVGNGKCRENTPKVHGLATCGEAIVLSPDSQRKTGEHASAVSFRSPRVAGRKCLVRNGCISPQNIAKVEQLKCSSKNVEQSSNVSGISSSTSSPLDILSEIVAEEIDGGRMKGKATLTIPDASKKQNENLFFATEGSRGTDNGEANRVSDAHRHAFGSQGLGGWRTTHTHTRKRDNSVPNERNSRRIGDVRSFSYQHESKGERGESGRNLQMVHGLSEGENDVRTGISVTETGNYSGQPRADKTVIKRLKKQGPSSSSHGECSTSMSEDPDILFHGPYRESMRSRSSRLQQPHPRATLGQVIDVDTVSPSIGHTTPQSDDSDVRAMQVEADEILARELQEQLYHEMPIVGGSERSDEHLAWALQQEENGSNTSHARQYTSHSRGSVISRVQRQPRRSTPTRPSRRGGIQSRVPVSSRMAQIRGRTTRPRHTVSSRARNLQFPLGMDLDMRLDILEALEAAVGDFGDVNMDNPIHQVQRDFNENDYEMLLALDEQNHHHGRTSTNLINSLPLSVVQTDNQEACAICLESPATGEIVRHLPCMHKFHQDCIDPWLSRKTSCPVCKLSIT